MNLDQTVSIATSILTSVYDTTTYDAFPMLSAYVSHPWSNPPWGKEEPNNPVGEATLKEKKGLSKSQSDRLQETVDCRSSQHDEDDIT
jgi:hypothetical protein